MPQSAQDAVNDRNTFRNIGIVVGGLVGLALLIAGWVTFLSHALEGKI